MSLQRFVTQAFLALLVVGCGKTVLGINHTLTPVSPGRKATQDCNTADAQVYAALDGKDPFDTSHVITLANTGCAVQVLVKQPTANLITLLGEIQKTSKSYTYFRAGSILVNVWIDDTPTTFNGPDGKPLDTSPANSDCTTAQAELKKLFDNVTFTSVVDQSPPVAARRCYVDAIFQSDSAFKGFLGWVNPKGHHEPFHYYVTTNGVTKVVYIHAVSPIVN